MSDLQTFDSEQFGKVRVVDINGEPWFVGKDIAAALGYQNPQKAVHDHVYPEDQTVNDSFTVNGTRGILINESGIYALIFSSKLPKAKDFKHWVTAEVLPAIRKTGTYSLGAAPGASAGGVAELIRITRRAMLDAGKTPQDVLAMVEHQYQVWCIPVPPALQCPAQLNMFSADYPALSGGGEDE